MGSRTSKRIGAGIISLTAVPMTMALAVQGPAAAARTAPAATAAAPSAPRTNMSYALYKARGGRITTGYNGYHVTPGRHEGIDFARGIGSDIHALVSGKVINVVQGRAGGAGLSTIAVYNAKLNKTIIYLHTAPRPSLRVGQAIARGQVIADESWRGVSAKRRAHTHVEMRRGAKKRAAKSVGDPHLDNPDPGRFWNSQGYNVR
ncbi:M23 family metallopeptidase [Actinomadura fibrosa]|uniref:Peptidoglycan DD-metalloendopeptidase family protein n=1 Tax=Actinomadura fibrosa TaxID=111802 RepID=A0ABW2XU38_9ACTN|nr:M23 family metallopeptidase [Actinomadura fibrosa]